MCFPISISKVKARQGRGNSRGQVNLNNIGRVWALGVVSSCLGDLEHGKYWVGVENQRM